MLFGGNAFVNAVFFYINVASAWLGFSGSRANCNYDDSKARDNRKHRRAVLGISGASGSIYALRLAKILMESGAELYCIPTDAAKKSSPRRRRLRTSRAR